MDVVKYADYFHDGTLLKLKHVGNKIEITIISAEIIPEHMMKNMPALNKNRITGKLCLWGIEKIKINKEPFTGILKKIMTVVVF
jgi:hypothetical protein